MATRDEKEILKIIEDEAPEEGERKGKLHEVKIARFMGLRLDYVRSILSSMGRRDLVDVSASGLINIADKGWKALGKRPPSPWGIFAPGEDASEPEEPAEERYKRWMTGEPKKVKKKKKKPAEGKGKDPTSYYRSYAELPEDERFRAWKNKPGGLEAPDE